MNIIWNIKLYHVSQKTGFKVKIEGDPSRGRSPWVFAEGTGHTPMQALNAAMDKMSESDQASFRLLINPDKP